MNHPLVGEWDKFVIMGQALALDGRISTGAKALYWVLSSYRNNKSGYSWPSMPTIRKCLGKSEATIRRLREELETWGLVDEYKSKSGRVRYRLKPYSKAVQMNRRREQKGSQSRRPTNDDTDWIKTTPEPASPASTKTQWEHHPAACMCVDCERMRSF